MFIKRICFFLAVLPVLICSCPPSGGTELPVVPPRYDKIGPAGYPVRIMCYVDTAKYNPVNALDYTLRDSGLPWFDYVILGAAQLKKNSRGVYLFVPNDLNHVLQRRSDFITPLQKKGIKVLLGLTGGRDAVSFGSITEDDMHILNDAIMDIVTHYGLDGVEFYDANGAKSSFPGEFPYPDGIYVDEWGTEQYVNLFTEDPDSFEAAWMEGGDRMNNLIYFLRLLLSDSDNQPIVVREGNYGNYLPSVVSAHDFTSRSDQISYIVNSDFSFMGNPNDPGEACNPDVNHFQFGPVIVNLEGNVKTHTVMPPLADINPGGLGNTTSETFVNIYDMMDQFMQAGDYGAIYYHNLKPASGVAQEFEIPGSGGTLMTQAEYMSISSQLIFGEDVVCTGGDYQKNW